jgi:fatty-acyl-CoA synthase
VTAADFRTRLKQHLLASENRDRVLLRIATSPERILEYTGESLVGASLELAEKYTAGVSAGKLVLLLLPHTAELFLLHLGLVLSGRVPAVLAWPTSRIDAEKYQRNLLHQLQSLAADCLITLPALSNNLEEHLTFPVRSCACTNNERWEGMFAAKVDLSGALKPESRPVPFEPGGDSLFLQFSGGTTGSQKAVVITAAILEAQIHALRDALAFGSEDSVVSWLPLYHDMGLIACFWLPLWSGAQALHFAATDWLQDPFSLFHYVERYRGTFAWLPNFAFAYLAQQAAALRQDVSLGSMRAWVNCSEPVRLKSVNAFAAAFAHLGVKAERIQASYAMAENVFAITQTRLGERLRAVRRSMVRHQQSQSLSYDLTDEVYVSSGPVIPGMSMRVVEPTTGAACEELEAGEILISTPSLFQGYWTEKGWITTSFGDDGWHRTGDYGFVSEGELFVIGRLKDIIIIGGQNIFPEDVEAAVNSIPEIYPGRAVAFGINNAVQDTESLVVVAELKGAFDPHRALQVERQIQRTVQTQIGITPRRVQVVPERWIVKSTAGKISRKETRERYLSELKAKIAAI